MLKVHILTRRRSDMTHEEYVAHWRDVHGPLFVSQPDVKRYVRRYIQCCVTSDRPNGPNLGQSDGIVELWFDDIDGYNAFATSASYLDVIQLDEERFSDPSRCDYFFSDEYPIIDQPAGLSLFRPGFVFKGGAAGHRQAVRYLAFTLVTGAARSGVRLAISSGNANTWIVFIRRVDVSCLVVSRHSRGQLAVACIHRQILTAVDGVSDGRIGNRAGQRLIPQHLAGLLIERAKVLCKVAEEEQIAGGEQNGPVDGSGSLEDVIDLSGGGIDLRNAGELVELRGVAHNAVVRGTRAGIAHLLFVAGVHEGHIQRIGDGAVALRPVAAGIEEAHRVGHVGMGQHGAFVQIRDAVLVDVLQEEVRHVVGPGVGPQELSRAAIEREDAAGFTGGQNNVAALAGLDSGVEPFGGGMRGIEGGGDQDAIVGPVFIPIVAGQMLVVPVQLAGVGVDRDGRIAEQIGGGVRRNGVEIAVAFQTSSSASDSPRPR